MFVQFKNKCTFLHYSNFGPLTTQYQTLTKSIFLYIRIVFFFVCSSQFQTLSAQPIEKFNNYLVPSDSFSTSKFYGQATVMASAYTITSLSLYHAWYKNYPQSSFHFFDDRKEWLQMDKMGHIYASYIQSYASFKLAKWAGLKKNHALLSSAFVGLLSQSTIELMDGYSEQWGFSKSDFLANIVGSSFFVAQEFFWDKQYVSFKVSNVPIAYNSATIYSTDGLRTSSLAKRATSLFGSNYSRTFLKDYNAQTIWACFHLKSFFPNNQHIPKWLNIALGYSGQNMFGGFENTWQESGHTFVIPENQLKRYRQYFLSLDVNFDQIDTKIPILNTIFDMIHAFHIPMPTLEYNSLGEFHLHFFM